MESTDISEKVVKDDLALDASRMLIILQTVGCHQCKVEGLAGLRCRAEELTALKECFLILPCDFIFP